ncbi:MAG: uroporphyrinogen-III synthase [Chloroflexota bacterium]
MRVLVTRPAEQARELIDLLAARGLAGVSVPAVVIRHEPAGSPFDAALDGLTGAAWLVITSANGAIALAARLRAMRRGMPNGTRLAAVGPATAAALRGAGFTVHHVPDDYLTVAIADGLDKLRGRRVVLARADVATPDLADALRALGAIVEEVVAYRTLEGPPTEAPALEAALHDGLDAISLTSGSTARGLAQLSAALPVQEARSLQRLPVFVIGPVTARAAQRAGFAPTAIATVHTAEALADTIAATLTAATLTPQEAR